MKKTKEVIQVPIIPSIPSYSEISNNKDLDYKNICVWVVIGFFLNQDTFFYSNKALTPATNYIKTALGLSTSGETYFKWHYDPREISLNQATEEFAQLFERITREQLGDRKVILPLSGGLDSRTQAAALKRNQNVFSFSYEFPNGIPEAGYARAIAKAMGFPFKAFTVPNGYLWDKIDQLAELNGCYSEFTHPRQMAFIDEYHGYG